jgi:hypothetical protein
MCTTNRKILECRHAAWLHGPREILSGEIIEILQILNLHTSMKLVTIFWLKMLRTAVLWDISILSTKSSLSHSNAFYELSVSEPRDWIHTAILWLVKIEMGVHNRSSQSTEDWWSKSSRRALWITETKHTLWGHHSRQLMIETSATISTAETIEPSKSPSTSETERRLLQQAGNDSEPTQKGTTARMTISPSPIASLCTTSHFVTSESEIILLVSSPFSKLAGPTARSTQASAHNTGSKSLTTESTSSLRSQGQPTKQPSASTPHDPITPLSTEPNPPEKISEIPPFLSGISVATNPDKHSPLTKPTLPSGLTTVQPPSTTPTASPGPTSTNKIPSTFPTSAKISVAIVLPLFALTLIILAIIYFRRHRRHSSSTPRYQSLASPIPQPSTSPSSATMHQRFTDSEPLIVIIEAGEGKTSIDETGMRWPENVVLTGDAKEFREATVRYEREWRERLRNSEERRGWEAWGA